MRKNIVLLVALLSLSSIVAVSLETPATPAPSNPQAVAAFEGRLQNLEKEVQTFRVSRDYFQSILTSQLTIFSTIVVVLMAASWGISYLRVGSEVQKEMKKQSESLDEWKKKQAELQAKKLDEEIARFKSMMRAVTANLHRAFAVTHQANPAVSHIWWVRAAKEFAKADGEDASSMVRICLTEASDALEKLKYRHDIDSTRGELQTMLAAIPAEKFGNEIRLLEENVDRIFRNPFRPATPGKTAD